MGSKGGGAGSFQPKKVGKFKFPKGKSGGGLLNEGGSEVG